MLTHSGEIFRAAQYLYSTPDYDGDPNVYRWNYFYPPVQIGDDVVGVRIAVKDLARGTNLTPESQLYHWGVKKDAPVDGGRRGPKVASSDVSLGTSLNVSIPRSASDVNPELGDGEENSFGAEEPLARAPLPRAADGVDEAAESMDKATLPRAVEDESTMVGVQQSKVTAEMTRARETITTYSSKTLPWTP